MALEVFNQQAATHENEQFRRVVKIIDAVFKKHNYEGILIGNPFLMKIIDAFVQMQFFYSIMAL